MTPNKEDYLKALFQCADEDQGLLVSNKTIAEALNISPASVTEMLIKLSREELIDYEPYKGSRLTPQGKELATALIRGHRLWEVFLSRRLHYSLYEAHEDAELLEHITPLRLTQRLEEFLDYPQHCPHGHPIPRQDGRIAPKPLLSLGELPLLSKARIQRVKEEKDLLLYLEKNGIKVGSIVQVIKKAGEQEPVTLMHEGRLLPLPAEFSPFIHVEVIKDPLQQ